MSNILVDISGNGNNGTIRAGVTPTKDGLQFNGTDTGVALGNKSFGIGDVSLLATLRMNNTSGIQSIFSQLNTFFGFSSGKPIWQINASSSYTINGTATLPVGTICTVVFVKSGTESGDAKIYVNGIQGDDAHSLDSNFASGNSYIGNQNNSTRYLNAELFDLKIYNRGVTEQEVIEYHNSFARQVSLLEDYRYDGADGVKSYTPDVIVGTGDYSVDELDLSNVNIEKVTNGTFDSATGWTIQGESEINNGSGRIYSSAGAFSALEQSGVFTTGVSYLVEFDVVESTTGSIQIGDGVAFLISNINGVGHKRYVIYPTGTLLRIARSGTTDIRIDNFSVKKMIPLPDYVNGQKYQKCTVAGTQVYQQNEAYGTWEFDVYKGADANLTDVNIIGSAHLNKSLINGYFVQLSTNEAIKLFKANNSGGGSSYNEILASANGYIANNTWYRIKITRTTDGEFTVYIKGGDFGDEYTLVDVSGGTGTNPVTDNTYTESKFLVVDADAGDKVGRMIKYRGVEQ